MKKQFITIALIVLFLMGAVGWNIIGFYASGPLEEPITLVFPSNTHFTDIVDTMRRNGLIRHPLFVKMALVLNGSYSHIRPGEYNFPARISESAAAELLSEGKTVIHHLTVPEGLMTSEILHMIAGNDLLSEEITLDVKEGELLPETYNFSRGDKRNDIITRMRHAMRKTLEDAWESRAPGLPLTTPEQALTLASIVEKETGIAAERPHVASVYINRLRKGMLLQADPTTAYAVTGGKAKMTRALNSNDLALNVPYNTYKMPGLPPGPIANPGKASIVATLHPLQTDDLYFVATGIGGHFFSSTVEQHQKNVKKYRETKKSQANSSIPREQDPDSATGTR